MIASVPGSTFINAQAAEMEHLVSRIKAVSPEWLDAALAEVERRCNEHGLPTVASLRSVYSDIIAAKWRPADATEA